MSVHHLRGRELARACALGAAAGLAGVAVMTTGEKIGQALTQRPDSFVPARRGPVNARWLVKTGRGSMAAAFDREPEVDTRPAM
jgi:hypothetical protein